MYGPYSPPKRKRTRLWITLAVVVLTLGGTAYTALFDPGFLTPKRQNIPRAAPHNLDPQTLMTRFAAALDVRDPQLAIGYLCQSAHEKNPDTIRTQVLARDRAGFEAVHVEPPAWEGTLWTEIHYTHLGAVAAPGKMGVGLEKGPEGDYCVVVIFP